jgi:uncharacterized membrane protein YdjX (TVP38/TMEM64 family)
MEQHLTAWKTYLAGGAIIVHQALKFAGIDVPSEELSELIDASLGVAAMIFRLMGHFKAKAAVEKALHTPVPEQK